MSKKVIKSVDVLDDIRVNPEEGKKTILKVIDKDENREDRMKSSDSAEVFPTPAEPVINEAVSSTLNQNIKDYLIQDLTKEDFVGDEDVKDVLDKVDIFKILNSVDGDLTESYGTDYGDINILFSRSSKDCIRESALIEYSTSGNKSYVLGLNILEAEDNKVNFVVKSSYGVDIYSKVCTPNQVANTVYRFLEAVYLRDKFASILNESVDSDRWGEIISDINEFAKNIDAGKDVLKISYSEDNSKPLEVTIARGTNDQVFDDVRKYIEDTYRDEVEITDINDSSFLLK